MQHILIRARQIKALYQRELTALNRNPHLDELQRKAHAERLWCQAYDQISQLRQSAEADLATLPSEQRSILEPPKRPDYLDPVE